MKKFKNSSWVPPLSNREIACRAYRLVQRVAPECLYEPRPFPVVDLLEFHLERLTGFSLRVEELPPSMEAYIDTVARELVLSLSVYEELISADSGRPRFTATHEVAHIDMHAGFFQILREKGLRPFRAHRGALRPFEDSEHQADVYASAILMPQPAVKRLVQACRRRGLTKEEIIKIMAKTFRVSRKAAMIRLKTYKEY